MADEQSASNQRIGILDRVREQMPDIAVPTSAEVREAPLKQFNEIAPLEYAEVYQKTCYPRLPFPDTKIIIEQFVSWWDEIGEVDAVLELGCGPVLSHIMTVVPRCQKIVMSDYLAENLDLIRTWVDERPGSYDWSGHVEYALLAEGRVANTQDIRERENEFRRKLSNLVVGDLRMKQPLGVAAQFPLVICCYATEQAANNTEEWKEVFSNLANCVEPGGNLAISIVKDSDFYVIGDGTEKTVRIPIAKVSDAEVLDAFLANGFEPDSIQIVAEECKGLAEQGLSELVIAFGRKKQNVAQ